MRNKIVRLHLRTVLFGHPLDTKHAEGTRVGVLGGIPIFGSDLISSEGYAPDAILYVLLAAGSLGYAYVMKVSLAIVLLLTSILLVYRKAIKKFPQGGGSYKIAHAYLGETAGLVAGASLTLDYVLTVAVSVSSAIENITGVVPWLAPTGHKVLADCLVIAFMAGVNLRGLKESARLFALPVYLYIISLVVLVGTGMVEIMVHGVTPLTTGQLVTSTGTGMTAFLFARAVAGGTTALTGVEAVSNGVTAFKAPSQKNAIKTLITLGVLVAFGLLGLMYLAGAYHIVPTVDNTSLNQLGLIIFGQTIPYYFLMASVAAILIIAANTPFAGLPILLSLMAKDGYVPRYYKNLGDRLVYSSGISTLFIVSLILILIFQGDTHLMLPLYAIGVLLSFALTGIGLARHMFQERGKGWMTDFAVFIFGGVVSFLVFLVFIVTKFTEGAWIVLIVLPLLVLLFRSINRVYTSETQVLSVTSEALADFHRHVAEVDRRRAHVDVTKYQNKIVVPLYDLNRTVLKTLKYAYALTPQVTAVHVASDPERKDKLIRHWAQAKMEIPLEIVESPYRAVVQDFLYYLDDLEKETNFDTITIAIPEFVPRRLRYNLLHNQTGQLLKLMLIYRKHFLVTSVPYHPAD